MEENLEKIVKLLQKEQANEALKCFNEITPVENIKYLMVKGQIEQKFQNWGKAINAFNKVLEIEPENQEAKSHLEMLHNILNFWNSGRLNV